MREAIGGALLIKLVMFFIVLYVCFFAIAINYPITFRVKNNIINLIEEYEGLDLAKSHIDEYIANVGFYRAGAVSFTLSQNTTCDHGSNGYCIQEKTSARGKYWKVTTYVTFDFPIIGRITNFPVSGETRVIYTG